MSQLFHSVDTLGLAERPKTDLAWIWDGIIGPGNVTLITSQWKSGKTTLLAHLLAQRKQPGVLAGAAVVPGVSAIVSEETEAFWGERHRLLGFGPADRFYCRPFPAAPTREQWHALIDELASLKQSHGVDLVAIDPLPHFLPGWEENHAPLLLEALSPLRKLTEAGQAVLLIHHPRKAAAAPGQTSRGSGFLPAFVDVLIEMYMLSPDNPLDRRRRLLGFSRHANTPRSLLIELNAAGTEFTCTKETPKESEFTRNWPTLHIVLEDAHRELTRQEILDQWPGTFPAPKSMTLWHWLNEALERGLLQREGTGHRADPYRYYLAEKMQTWKDDPFYEIARKMREGAKAMEAAFPPKYDVTMR